MRQTKTAIYYYLALMSFLLSFVLTRAALANPEGGTVTHGDAQIHHVDPNYTEIQQTTQKAIIQWQSFNIGAGQHTHFNQPNQHAITLNRVVSNQLSAIAGRLSAVGRIVLINQNGILFDRGSIIDTAGLIASTSDIKDHDFLNDRFHFTQPGKLGARIENRGSIFIRHKGMAALMAPHVVNNGLIHAELGKVVLASGERFELDMGGSVKIATNQATLTHLSNQGEIYANGGRVVMSMAAAQEAIQQVVNMDGIIRADTIHQHQGEIILAAKGNAAIHIAGTLSVEGEEQAGQIDIDSPQILLKKGSHINASATHDAGLIRIGGKHTEEITIEEDAKIIANAIYGTAGTVDVIAKNRLNYASYIEATSVYGHGGFIETSASQVMITGTANASSLYGTNGHWLIDPTNITVNATLAASISATLNTGTNMTIETPSAGGDAGNITINSAINKTAGGNASLLFKAHNNIVVNGGGDITSTSGELDITLHADSDNSGEGAIRMNSGSAFTSLGGDITLGGGLNPLTDAARGVSGANREGIDLNNASLISNGGTVTLNGRGHGGTANGNYGVYLRSGTTINTGDGNIVINGTGGGSGASRNNRGVYINGNTTSLNTNNGNITITGTGGSGERNQQGVYVNNADLLASGNGAIALTGTGGTGTGSGSRGVLINGSDSVIEATTGNITITGTAGSGTNNLQGITVQNDANIRTTSTGSITMTGTGGTGSLNNNRGIHITGTNTAISTAGGNINVTGTGGSGSATTTGVQVNGGATLSTTGSGAVNITGTGGTATGNNSRGIRINNGTISTADGNITLDGTGGTANNNDYGIDLTNSATIHVSGSGNINLEGQSGGNEVDINNANATAKNIGSATQTGNITVTADTLNIPNTNFTTQGNLIFAPRTANTAINIGSNGATLNINNTILGNSTIGGELVIGDSNSSGDININITSNPNHGIRAQTTGNVILNNNLDAEGDVTFISNELTINNTIEANNLTLQANNTVNLNTLPALTQGLTIEAATANMNVTPTNITPNITATTIAFNGGGDIVAHINAETVLLNGNSATLTGTVGGKDNREGANAITKVNTPSDRSFYRFNGHIIGFELDSTISNNPALIANSLINDINTDNNISVRIDDGLYERTQNLRFPQTLEIAREDDDIIIRPKRKYITRAY